MTESTTKIDSAAHRIAKIAAASTFITRSFWGAHSYER